MAQELKKLSSRHRKIMYSLCEGMKPCEISVVYNISETHLSVLRRSPIWIEEERLIRESMLEAHKTRAHGMLTKAQDVMEKSMDSYDEKIALAAAKDTLNRGGLVYEPTVEDGTAQVRIILGD